MKLIGSLSSPYVRKLRVILLEKALPFEFVLEMPWEPTTHITDYNPLGKVPAFVTDDGETLFDSSLIAAYLETLDAAPALLPADPREAIRVRQLATLADGITDAGVVVFQEGRRPADKQIADWSARFLGKVMRGLDALEAKLAGRAWLYGDGMTLADISAGCMLYWLDFRLPQVDWRSGRPALAAFAERIGQRPSFQQTIPVA